MKGNSRQFLTVDSSLDVISLDKDVGVKKIIGPKGSHCKDTPKKDTKFTANISEARTSCQERPRGGNCRVPD